MRHLVKDFKRLWVICIDFTDFIRFYKTSEDPEDILEYLNILSDFKLF